MNEMINKFIGKECIINTENELSILGIINSYNDGWIEIENKGRCSVVNCQYIIMISDAI